MKTAVVFNPTKAADPVRTRDQICRALVAEGLEDPWWLETTADDSGAGATREAIRRGADLIVVSGGDGTASACAEALAGTQVAMALLPAGTGNLLARNFDVPRDLAAAAEVAAHGRALRIDVGVVGDRRFLVMAGIGFDAQMLADAPETLKARIGWPAYVVSASRHLLERRHAMTVALDGRPTVRFRGRGVLVGNVGRLQGNLPVLPLAAPDDGLLDVAVLQPRGLISWAALGVALVLRRPRPRRLQTYQATTVDIHCDAVLPTEVDGELLEPANRLEISLLPAALTLMVPRG